MNNNIQEDYVSFEVAKLLKEKGFEVPIRNYSLQKDKHETIYEGFDDNYWGDNRVVNWNNDIVGIKPFTGFLSRPTIALAVKWLHENFTTWLNVEPTEHGFWRFIIFSKEVMDVENLTKAFYSSPQEAYQAALEYTLKNSL